jgi:hypothetical protein
MAKVPSIMDDVEPVIEVGRKRSDPLDPRLCHGGGKVNRGVRPGRDDDLADFSRDDRRTNFAYDGEDGLPLDQKLIL